jgi:hypothetical protein
VPAHEGISAYEALGTAAEWTYGTYATCGAGHISPISPVGPIGSQRCSHARCTATHDTLIRFPTSSWTLAPISWRRAYSVALKNSTVRFSNCTRSPGSSTMWVEPAIGRNWKERPAFSRASISLRLCRK